MNVTDGTGRAWCMHCAMLHFVGIPEESWTQENEEAFIFNVTRGYISNLRGGALTDTSQMVPRPLACARCRNPLTNTAPPTISDRYSQRSDF